jgi:hypothetical protein
MAQKGLDEYLLGFAIELFANQALVQQPLLQQTQLSRK